VSLYLEIMPPSARHVGFLIAGCSLLLPVHVAAMNEAKARLAMDVAKARLAMRAEGNKKERLDLSDISELDLSGAVDASGVDRELGEIGKW